jgi:hypothetical protein
MTFINIVFIRNLLKNNGGAFDQYIKKSNATPMTTPPPPTPLGHNNDRCIIKTVKKHCFKGIKTCDKRKLFCSERLWQLKTT